MSTALRKQNFATFHQFTVVAGGAATQGMAVFLSGADTTVDNCAADADTGIGIAMQTATAGNTVEVALFGPVVACLVGTGGATRSTKAILVTDGFTDAPAHDSSGATNDQTYGTFMQSGSATERVGLLLSGASNRGSA
jgi:hypothetical protein